MRVTKLIITEANPNLMFKFNKEIGSLINLITYIIKFKNLIKSNNYL